MPGTDVDVCVIGAGFAGLSAALRLREAGHSLAVLEARDRVGGRTFTEPRDDGVYIDHGGTWIGPGQDRVHALMREFDIPSYRQYTDGEAMMLAAGRTYRYGGQIPWSMNPLTSVNLGAAFLEMARLAKSVPAHAPWTAAKAGKWDSTTLAQWLDRVAPNKQAHQLLELALAGTFTSAASEVSMLWVLTLLSAAGGPDFVLGVKDGAEDARPVGGMGAIYGPVAERVAGDIHLEQPVRAIEQDGDGVTVRSDGMAVRASRAVVAVPIAIAGQICYEPMLPIDRSMLNQRMPSGAVLKTHLIYDEPFWRADGLTGQSAAPGTVAPITLDACTDSGRPGVMAVITEGPGARALSRLPAAERRSAIIASLTERFGSRAGAPIQHTELDWTVERYSGGGMISHAPTGVLTEFGPALREPCGRIHWAGTESSPVMMGFVDGAIRSGERAAREICDIMSLQVNA